MSNYSFEVTGDKELFKKLTQVAAKAQVKEIVKRRTAQMQKQIQKNMTIAYKGHYEGKGNNKKFVPPTGTTRRHTFIQLSEFSGMVYVDTDYIGYLENGTRFMKARPTVGPGFRQIRPLFISDLKNLTK